MLTSIQVLGYRSLRYVSQRVLPFQMLVGPNGSGKTTFLDAVGFVGDLLKSGPLQAVQQRAPDLQQLTWLRQGTRFEIVLDLAVPPERLARLGSDQFASARYAVAIEAAPESHEVSIAAENLWLTPDLLVARPKPLMFPEMQSPPTTIVQEPKRGSGWKKIVAKIAGSGNDNFTAERGRGWNSTFRLGPGKSALANLPEDEGKFPVATWAKRFLMEGVGKIVLNADAIRQPAPSGSPRQYQTDGSNLPWVIHALESDQVRFGRWLAHFQTAVPDLKTVTTVLRPEDNARYIVVEYQNGLKAPSWLVSDGTLRMLALTLLSYAKDIEGIYLIEEPENGLYPKAIEAVYQSLSSAYSAQVLCASHSPVVLGLASLPDLLCFAKTATGSTDIVGGAQHPRLRDMKGRRDLDLGLLFAAGVIG